MQNDRQTFSSRTTFYSPAAKLTIKKTTYADGNSTNTVTGYPIVWGATSSDRGGYKVRLAKGSAAFTPDVMSLWHHNFAQPLAGTVNKTLRILSADDVGIPVEIDLDLNTTAGSDAYAYISSKLVGGMSFSMANGFEDYAESEEKMDDGSKQKIITVNKFTCDEVTVTPIPAFTATTVKPKTDAEYLEPEATGTPAVAGGMSEGETELVPARIGASLKLRKMRLEMLGN